MQVVLTVCPYNEVLNPKYENLQNIHGNSGSVIKMHVLHLYNISSLFEYTNKKCWDSKNKSTPDQILNDATYRWDELVPKNA